MSEQNKGKLKELFELWN